ncbi:MAG TPA: biotin transporter BioY [Xanthobacteraceae bacterium]|nr:biotin transporter BioY [Xanthobacteraceae bacterium]
MYVVTERNTLAEALWPAQSMPGWLRNVLLAIGGSLLLTLSAKINVPFYPVPMTMQTFAVLLIGAAFGWRLGAATVLLYLAQGAFGFPVFAGTPEKGLGLAYMMGPTGGYLIGFVVAAALVGWLAERGWDRSFLSLAAAMFIGHVVISAYGVAWLGSSIGLVQAWTVGVLPFFYANIFKTLLAAACLRAGWSLANFRG